LGSGGIAAGIPDLGTRWRLVVSFTPRPLYPQEKSLAKKLRADEIQKYFLQLSSGIFSLPFSYLNVN
jgi:hypothetical protein